MKAKELIEEMDRDYQNLKLEIDWIFRRIYTIRTEEEYWNLLKELDDVESRVDSFIAEYSNKVYEYADKLELFSALTFTLDTYAKSLRNLIEEIRDVILNTDWWEEYSEEEYEDIIWDFDSDYL